MLNFKRIDKKLRFFTLALNYFIHIVANDKPERMTFDVAKQAIDYIFDHEEDFPEESVTWDFIGGEPFLEVEKGSYDDVVKNIPLWLSQFPNDGTKVTISSADIKYINESVIHLYSLGIHNVSINCVFENVWHDGDDKLFEDQLKQLVDSIIDGGWYKDYACSFFDENIGKPMDSKLDNNNWYGAGKMLSIDAAGNFYPCTRFAGYSLRSKKPIIIGQLYKLDHAPICRHCDAYQCRRCVWLNRKTTLEVNTPSHEQCVVAHLERNASRMLLRNIRKHGQFLPQQEDIKEIDYLDPFDKKEEWL